MPCLYFEIWRKRSLADDVRLTEQWCCLVNVPSPEQLKVKSPFGHEFEHGGERGKHQHQTVRGVHSTAPAMEGGLFRVLCPVALICCKFSTRFPMKRRTEALSVQPHDRCLRLCLVVPGAFLPFRTFCVLERGWWKWKRVLMSCKYGEFWWQPWWTAALFLQAGDLLGPLNPRWIPKRVDRVLSPSGHSGLRSLFFVVVVFSANSVTDV